MRGEAGDCAEKHPPQGAHRTAERPGLHNSLIRHVRKEIGTPLNSGVLLLPFVIGLLLFEILRSNNVDLPHLAPDEGGGGLCGGLPHEMYYNIVTAVASRSLVQPCRGNSAGLFVTPPVSVRPDISPGNQLAGKERGK